MLNPPLPLPQGHFPQAALSPWLSTTGHTWETQDASQTQNPDLVQELLNSLVEPSLSHVAILDASTQLPSLSPSLRVRPVL